MEQTPTPQPPSLTAISAAPATAPAPTYPESLDASPRSRNTDSWGEDNSLYPSNNGTTAMPPQAGLTKLRLMCSYGGHIVPRPHDKSLCYVGGDTRIVVVDRQTTLSDLTNRLAKPLLRSSSSSLTSTTASFTLKYQLPSEDLDSLISVTTDEDLENMIDEYERLNSSSHVSKSSRLRLFLFPTKPESVSSIGSLLENSTKSEDWFLNALNGTTSGFSDTSSVNCLLGLDEDVSVQEKKDVDHKGVIGKNPKANNSAQDIHSVADLERTSSFGSASSSPSLASLPPIRVHIDDNQKVAGIEEQFSHMTVQQQHQKQQDDGGYVAAPAPVVVSGVSLSSTPVAAEYNNRVLSEDERSEQAYQKHQQQQYQQMQSAGFDQASLDSVSSDGRQKTGMIYQDQFVQMQTSNNNNRTADMNNIPDQNTRMQMQQQQQQQHQQQIADSAYLMSMSNTQVDPQHPQMHHQQPQFIHTAVPPPQYIQHHPSGAVPMGSYYQMYPSQGQHPHHPPPIDQQNFVYYMPARQAPHGYNMQMQQQASGYAEVPSAAAASLSHNQAPPPAYNTNRGAQTAPKNESPSGVYGTTNPGASQFVQVSSNQPQPQAQAQPQYIGYSQIHHPSQSVANSVSGAGPTYGYDFTDPAQGQHMYYAAQPMPPQSTAQFQTVTAESGSFLPADHSTKQQQQGRPQQP
ncbi:hypothetical protein SSX86_028872 [Deinandra increscens subsp. villosa]|uniref:PB1 domain-containing protein n=1 Tax=Deinandra increscens subsp. villosa TaxID=3103831 RepID=A0AAP0GJN7_9ASTR